MLMRGVGRRSPVASQRECHPCDRDAAVLQSIDSTRCLAAYPQATYTFLLGAGILVGFAAWIHDTTPEDGPSEGTVTHSQALMSQCAVGTCIPGDLFAVWPYVCHHA